MQTFFLGDSRDDNATALEKLNRYIADGGYVEQIVETMMGVVITAYSSDEYERLECSVECTVGCDTPECCDDIMRTEIQQGLEEAIVDGIAKTIHNLAVESLVDGLITATSDTPRVEPTEEWTPKNWVPPIAVRTSGDLEGLHVSSSGTGRTSSFTVSSTPDVFCASANNVEPSRERQVLSITIEQNMESNGNPTIFDGDINGNRLVVTCENGVIAINLYDRENNVVQPVDAGEKNVPIPTGIPTKSPDSVRTIIASCEPTPQQERQNLEQEKPEQEKPEQENQQQGKKIIQLEIDAAIPTKDLVDLFSQQAIETMFNQAASGETLTISVHGPVYKNVVILD